MKSRIIVAIVGLPILFIVLFFLPPYIFAAVVSLVCAIIAFELLRSIAPKGNERSRIYAVFSAALIPVGAYFDITALVFQAVFLVLLSLMFIEAIKTFGTIRKVPLSQILITLFGGALIPLMLSGLVSMRNMPEGHLIVLLPVISAFVTDAGAYFSGLLFGKRKPFPLVSPKKTVEGYIGGFIVGTLAMVIYGMIIVFATLHTVVFYALILYGIIGAAATHLGDLAFSLIKREYEIKDYGSLLRGHGGMLDRFDSMVLAAPAIYLLMLVTPAIIVG